MLCLWARSPGKFEAKRCLIAVQTSRNEPREKESVLLVPTMLMPHQRRSVGKKKYKPTTVLWVGAVFIFAQGGTIAHYVFVLIPSLSQVRGNVCCRGVLKTTKLLDFVSTSSLQHVMVVEMPISSTSSEVVKKPVLLLYNLAWKEEKQSSGHLSDVANVDPFIR